MLTEHQAALAKLISLWRRRARVDTDPANGSATQQAAGRASAQCANELEAYLETLLREAS